MVEDNSSITRPIAIAAFAEKVPNIGWLSFCEAQLSSIISASKIVESAALAIVADLTDEDDATTGLAFSAEDES